MGTGDLFSPNVIAVMLLWVYCQPMTPPFLLVELGFGSLVLLSGNVHGSNKPQIALA